MSRHKRWARLIRFRQLDLDAEFHPFNRALLLAVKTVWSQRVYSRTSQFKIGDRVRVSNAVASEYAGSTGTVVAVEQRAAGVIQLSECDIEFADGVRRRFLGFHLTEAEHPFRHQA